MIRYHGRKHASNGERGVTMIIVVIAMLAMLAMVALAVDVITLYAARSEAQRGADSAAIPTSLDFGKPRKDMNTAYIANYIRLPGEANVVKVNLCECGR